MSINSLFYDNDFHLHCDKLTCNNINSNCLHNCQNVGSGVDVFKDITGDNTSRTANFRSLIAGNNITLTQNTNDILIDAGIIDSFYTSSNTFSNDRVATLNTSLMFKGAGSPTFNSILYLSTTEESSWKNDAFGLIIGNINQPSTTITSNSIVLSSSGIQTPNYSNGLIQTDNSGNWSVLPLSFINVNVFNVFSQTINAFLPFSFDNYVLNNNAVTINNDNIIALRDARIKIDYNINSTTTNNMLIGITKNDVMIPQSINGNNGTNKYQVNGDCIFDVSTNDVLKMVNLSKNNITTDSINESSFFRQVDTFSFTTSPTINYVGINVENNSSIYLLIVMEVGNQGPANNITDNLGNVFVKIIDNSNSVSIDEYVAIYAFDYTSSNTVTSISIANGNLNWYIETIFITNTENPSYSGISYTNKSNFNTSINVNDSPYLNILALNGIISSTVPNSQIVSGSVPVTSLGCQSGYYYGFNPLTINVDLNPFGFGTMICLASIRVRSFPSCSSRLTITQVL